MSFNYKIEQARNGKIGIYGGIRTAMLSLSQIESMGIDVYGLDDFSLEAFHKAYRMEDIVNAGLPAPRKKRYAFFTELLEEHRAQPQTPQRDEAIRLLNELLDELPKDWISYEYRPPQKFIGSISGIYGHAEKIVFKTGGGERLWEVAHTPELREFVMHGWDIGRHRRYDWDIDTDLVASVKETTLEKLEWLVPWNENAPLAWKLENAETLLCSCVVHSDERNYQFIQANAYYMEDKPRYRYSEFFLTLRRCAPAEIIQMLRDCGTSIEFFRTGDNQIDWPQVALVIAKKELTDPKHEERQDLTYDEVRQKIEQYTKLDLSACKPAAGLQEEV